MAKGWKSILICVLIVASVWSGKLLADREMLNRGLIRLHIVANSDSSQDQAIKQKVRDTVIDSIQQDLEKVADISEARAYLQSHLPQIEAAANRVLQLAGFDGQAVVTLCREAFDTRYYETFSLPSGVYEALRVTIGEGKGKNWWCVAYPSLCMPATAEEVKTVAAGVGFSRQLSETLTGEKGYEIRFFLLDCLGRLENYLRAE